jgi:cation transport regulator ChaC
LFGEILAGLRLIVRMAGDARRRGDPYGPVTMRIVKAAERETQVYSRNRETLFAVRDPELRARTHVLLAQMSLTLEAILEAAAAIDAADEAEAAGHDRERVAARRAAAVEDRGSSFDFMLELHAELPPLIARYEKLAGQTFDETDRVIRPPAPATET